MNSLTLSVLLTTFLQSQSEIANQFNGYLILGYFAMWVVGSIYVISLITRQRNLEQDIQLMHKILREDKDSAD